MKNLKTSWLLVPLAIIGVGCGKTATDDTLKNDLALASQAQQYAAQPVISPTEQGLAASPYTTPAKRAPTVNRAPASTVRRTTSSRSSGSSAGQVVYQPAPQPVVKHTDRDAAIGAVAGGVIGAVSSRDKVKGGLIGAAAGAILGGVIGNNVDVKRPN